MVKVKEAVLQKTIYRKDQKRVVYVTADMAGELESPVYAILGMNEELQKMKLPAGYKVNELYMEQPSDESDFTVKWDGEWQITLEVFRDLGIAFGVVIVIIYSICYSYEETIAHPLVAGYFNAIYTCRIRDFT